jgi:hypothetical protein
VSYDTTTIAVALGSLEEAIAGIKRGERWECDGFRLLSDSEHLYVGTGGALPLRGWRRGVGSAGAPGRDPRRLAPALRPPPALVGEGGEAMSGNRRAWWYERWWGNPFLRAWVELRFVVANVIHRTTRVCWSTLAEWAMGMKPDTVVKCDLCEGCGYTWCGRKR